MHKLTIPLSGLPALNVGDSVALVAPSSHCLSEQSMQNVVDYVRQKAGLIACYETECFRRTPANERAELFLKALLDPNMKAVWAIRGGEGAADIVPFLEQSYREIQTLSPKLLVGFSDITVLLLYFSQRYKWPVVHGAGILQMAEKKITQNSIQATWDVVLNKKDEMEIGDMVPFNHWAEKASLIDAELIGGNLSLLHCSTKEVWELQAKNKILVIEEVREKPHVVGRTLKHLQRIGLFEGAKAIIFGDMAAVPVGYTSEEQENNKHHLTAVLKEFAEQSHVPIWFTSQIGHGEKNFPLVFSSKCRAKINRI